VKRKARGAIALLVSLAVSGVLSVSSKPLFAQGGSELVVLTPVLYGPVVAGVISPIMKSKYNVTVRYEDLLSSEIMAKVQAEKARPEASVACPSADGLVSGMRADLWQKLDLSVVTNIKELAPFARLKPYGEYGVGISGATAVLEYHTGVFKEKGWKAPTSWWDLKDPRYKGRVGLTSTTSGTAVGLLMFWARVLDPKHPRGNVDAAFNFASDLVKAGQILSFPTRSSEVNQLMERGEIWIATQYSEGAYQFAAKGAPVSAVTPQEGTVLFATGCSIVKAAPNPKMANEFINLMIGARYQRALALDRWSIPANSTQELPPSWAKYLSFSKEQQAKMYVPDVEEFAEFRPAWHNRWVKEIESRR